jgi:hypothetical protein
VRNSGPKALKPALRGAPGGTTVFEMVNGFEVLAAIFGLPSTFPGAWPLTPGLVLNGPSTSPSEYGNPVFTPYAPPPLPSWLMPT